MTGIDTEVDSLLQKKLNQMEMRKKIEEACTGIECLKNDIKKVTNKHNCPICGQKKLEIGDSYCSNCGEEIEGWDELEGWIPYHRRSRGK